MVYCIGPYISYEVLIYCSLIAPVIFLIAFTFLPESPYYLLQKEKKTEALASLSWLRKGRTPDDIEKELNMMQVISSEAIIFILSLLFQLKAEKYMCNIISAHLCLNFGRFNTKTRMYNR